MNDSEVIIKQKNVTKEETKTPSLYVVLLHNDNMTPRGFVVLALKKCFGKPEAEAQQIMMRAHDGGHAVVATFTREIAETKAAKANDFAAERGYFLLFTVEKQ